MLQHLVNVENADRGTRPRSFDFDKRGHSLSREYPRQPCLLTEAASRGASLRSSRPADADRGSAHAPPGQSGAYLVNDGQATDSGRQIEADEESLSAQVLPRPHSEPKQKTRDFDEKAYPSKIKFDSDSDDMVGPIKPTVCQSGPFLGNDIGCRLYPTTAFNSKSEAKPGNKNVKPPIHTRNDQGHAYSSHRKPVYPRVQLIRNTLVLTFMLACSALFMFLIDYNFKNLG